MQHRIKVSLSEKSIDNAISELQAYKKNLPVWADEICKRLAFMGATKVSLGFSRATYSGDKDVEISVEPIPHGYSIKANGESVLFIEFGAGVTYGYGHPEAKKYGMGPGTYPGEGHWDNPSGWWIPQEKGGGHTYGNPPAAVMFHTANELRDSIYEVAREVINGSRH